MDETTSHLDFGEMYTRNDSEDEDNPNWESDGECDSEESDDYLTLSRNRHKRAKISWSSDSEENQEDNSHHLGSLIKDIVWTDRNSNPIVGDFDAQDSGCKVNMSENTPILQFFQIFFSEDLVGFIVDETNRFYRYATKDAPQGKSRLNKWKDTTVGEMYRFLAATMLMSRVKKLSLAEYWSTDHLLKTDIFPSIMSRDRYMLLLRMLHFNDNDIPAYGNRLIKIEKVLEKLRTNFKESFAPYKNVCIYERLLFYKEKLLFKQNVPSRRNRIGIKTFMLCDSQSGYILDMIIYTGSFTKIVLHHPELGLEGNIVMSLLQPYLGKNHTLYIDDWFTSPALFVALHNNGTFACGMVRKNTKGLPKMPNKLKKGEMSFRSTDTLLALKWNDKREVWMLSTFHQAEAVNTGKIHQKTGELINKPNCVLDYNSVMSALDKTDMLLSSIESVRKTSKWYKKMFFHLMDICIYNAHILHNEVSKKSMTFATFHLKLIREILEAYHVSRSKACGGKTCRVDHYSRLIERHFPSVCKSEKNVKKLSMRKCVVCRKHKERRESRYQCKTCNVGLCVVPCFEIYHTIKDY